jgi:hypothetical protein
MKMKTTILVILSVIVVAVLIYLSNSKHDGSNPQMSSAVTFYRPSIEAGTDSAYHLVVFSTTQSYGRSVKPNGDTTKIGKYIDGFYKLDIANDVFGYDTSLITFVGNKIIAKKVGNTKVILRLPNKLDTLEVTVERIESIFCIH